MMWEKLYDIIREVSSSEKLFIEGNLNGYVGTDRRGFERVHKGFDMTNKTKREKKSRTSL
jgi:formiminotetrahydrofolate cyclodeaminase